MSVACSFLAFLRTFDRIGSGGKAYARRPDHGIERASAVQAAGSGTGESKVGSLWLNLVANRSTRGRKIV